jgi:microsomal epoxide hydrolase
MYTVPQALSTEGFDEIDKKAVERFNYFNRYEFAYRDEHATKPATIGMVVESSPVALLAWYVSPPCCFVMLPAGLQLFTLKTVKRQSKWHI